MNGVIKRKQVRYKPQNFPTKQTVHHLHEKPFICLSILASRLWTSSAIIIFLFEICKVAYSIGKFDNLFLLMYYSWVLWHINHCRLFRAKSSSTENDINTRLAKAWTANDRLSVIWKSDLNDKIKRRFFQAAVVSIMLYECTTWTLTKRM